MAVESRFVVIRNGVEVETFMDKKAADEYDKMLDMADAVSELLTKSPVELTEQLIEDLGIYLAKEREELLIALQAKKAKSVPAKKAAKPQPLEKAS
jgi:dsDNA-binding SOS-regulon protein